MCYLGFIGALFRESYKCVEKQVCDGVWKLAFRISLIQVGKLAVWMLKKVSSLQSHQKCNCMQWPLTLEEGKSTKFVMIGSCDF